MKRAEKSSRQKLERTENQITIYHERSLHAFLKSRFCPDEEKHEVKIGRFVADACDGNVIYEIQTGNFGPLAKKIKFYLENTDYKIVVVRPLAKNHRISWLDTESGELQKSKRPSPKHENLASGIADLHYLRELFGNERLSFCFLLMEINEVRLLDGYGKYKKIRATSVDRLAGEIYSEHFISTLADVESAILPLLPDGEFSRAELAKALGLKALKLWSAQKFLVESGLLTSKSVGNKLIFSKNKVNT